MRIQKVDIQGYGRLAETSLEFDPELQVIMGPNEKGKSTLRCFVSDMLYGQKRSAAQRAYEESNALRVPWQEAPGYGGSLWYALQDGRVIEVIRSFDRQREFTQVFDRNEGREITAEFPQLRNREIDFAAAHLGLGKDVFQGSATISHLSLQDLGDKAALAQIREKLLSLTDSGGEGASSESVLHLLRERIQGIGQPNARTKPLPAARQRLAELDEEWDQVHAAASELRSTADRRRAILDESGELRERRAAIERDLAVLEAHARRGRLEEAEAIQKQIDQVTQQSFSLGSAREFPVELDADLRRATQAQRTVEMQLERSRTELRNLEEQLAAEEQRHGGPGLPELPEDLGEAEEAAYGELAARKQRLDDQLEEISRLVAAAEKRIEDAHDALERMPDFGRLSADPVEWFTQLASSFNMAIRSRDEECAKRDRLRAEVSAMRAALEHPQAVFQGVSNFFEHAREFELDQRMYAENRKQRAKQLHSLQLVREEISDRIPGLLGLTAFCGIFLAVLLGAYFVTRKSAIFIAGGVIFLALLYFVSSLTYMRARLTQLAREIEETQRGLAEVESNQEEGPGPMGEMMRRAECSTTRELEALYEQYRESKAKLAARAAVLQEQEDQAAEYEERIPKLLARLRETFSQVGEAIDTEMDVSRASANAITRYQEYRETKRRLSDGRAVLDRHQAERKRVLREQSEVRAALDNAEVALRQLMRKHGFEEERDYATAQAALRACRQRASRRREQRGRLELLRENTRAMERQIHEEVSHLERRRQMVRDILRKGNVESVEAWQAMEGRAREFGELRQQRQALEAQQSSLLGGGDLQQLRAQVEGDGPLPPRPERTAEQLRAALAEISSASDERTQEEHALHIAMTERMAGMRGLSEIEEEREAVAAQVRDLECELEAASHAMAIVEEISRGRHARVAPRLAERAGALLEEITGGAYAELSIGKDLNVSVRIPETRRMAQSPEKALSKGTVDQVYLALRLALVQTMSEGREPIPMLLDDPFANYDDARLERTMRVVRRVAEENQVLLFTCREDVVRAAARIDAPVIRL